MKNYNPNTPFHYYQFPLCINCPTGRILYQPSQNSALNYKNIAINSNFNLRVITSNPFPIYDIHPISYRNTSPQTEIYQTFPRSPSSTFHSNRFIQEIPPITQKFILPSSSPKIK